MSNKEILAIYKIAEKHWSRPKWLCWILGWNNTNWGLCFYFDSKASEYYYSNYFEKLWYPYRTIQFDTYHFQTRKERLQAIRNVIKDLENENTIKKPMSNKKQTPVNWLVFELSKVGYLPDGLPTDIHNKALKMESKKQQKYDEMLAMLEELKGIFDKYSVDFESEFFKYKQPLEQLIKEAKEL